MSDAVLRKAEGESVFERFGTNAAKFATYGEAHQSIPEVQMSGTSLQVPYRFSGFDQLHQKNRIQYCFTGTTMLTFPPLIPTDGHDPVKLNWILAKCPGEIKFKRANDEANLFLLVYHNAKINMDYWIRFVAIDKATGATLDINQYHVPYYFNQGRMYFPGRGAKFDLAPAESCAEYLGRQFNDLDIPVDNQSFKRFFQYVFANANLKKQHVEQCIKILAERRSSKGLEVVSYYDLYLVLCVYLDQHCLAGPNNSIHETGVAEVLTGGVFKLKRRAMKKITRKLDKSGQL
jgi:hypothetical protein